MGKQMKNAPVYFTVAQIQFNPVLKMEDYLPAIQDRMRTIHFPDFRRENFQQITLSLSTTPEGGQAPIPSVVPQPRCIFGNIEQTAGFILDNNSLALQTTDYLTHKDFFRAFLDGLRVIDDVLKLDFTSRIGLRYFDAVLPRAGQSLDDYLIPEVLGLSKKLTNNKVIHSFSETFTAGTNGHLASRVIIRNGQVGLPPEVNVLAPPISSKFLIHQGLHAIIDIDAFSEERSKFKIENVETKLLAFHDDIDKAFKVIATPFALSVWE